MFRVLFLTAVLTSGAALASGRAGFRLAYPFSIRIYAEQILVTIPTPAFKVEVSSGVEVNGFPFTITPYSGVYIARPNFWLGLLVGRNIGPTSGFNVVLIGGWTWEN